MSGDPSVLLQRLASAVEGRYRIEKEAGRGSMARIYQAVAVDSGRPVAVKLLPPEVATVANAERFHREIALTKTLDHPNILPLIDSGGADGLYWYVMPFVIGETIREALTARGLMPIPQVLDIVAQVGGALSYAHSRGVVHRDLKPENIMISDGRALVVDFGLARVLDTQSNLTGTGMPLGTPAYMSPEQIAGAGAVDVRADVYSLGCVVYEMLTGRPPFIGRSVVQLLQGHLNQLPDPPSRHRRGIGPVIDGAIVKALAKTPDLRQGSVDRFVSEISASTEAGQPSPEPPSPAPRAGGSGAGCSAGGRSLGAAGAYLRGSDFQKAIPPACWPTSTDPTFCVAPRS